MISVSVVSSVGTESEVALDRNNHHSHCHTSVTHLGIIIVIYNQKKKRKNGGKCISLLLFPLCFSASTYRVQLTEASELFQASQLSSLSPPSLLHCTSCPKELFASPHFCPLRPSASRAQQRVSINCKGRCCVANAGGCSRNLQSPQLQAVEPVEEQRRDEAGTSAASWFLHLRSCVCLYFVL